jgi:anti-sigma B factor antagonist
MTIQQNIIGTAATLTLSNRMITGQDVAPFQYHIQNLIAQNIKHVTVDLSNVPYFGAAMLGVLVHGLTTLRAAGGTLKLIGVNTRIAQIFQVAKLNTIFQTPNVSTHHKNLTPFPKTVPLLHAIQVRRNLRVAV